VGDLLPPHPTTSLTLAPGPQLWDLEPDTGPTGEDLQKACSLTGHRPLVPAERSAARLAHQSGGLGVPSSNLGAPTKLLFDINRILYGPPSESTARLQTGRAPVGGLCLQPSPGRPRSVRMFAMLGDDRGVRAVYPGRFLAHKRAAGLFTPPRLNSALDLPGAQAIVVGTRWRDRIFPRWFFVRLPAWRGSHRDLRERRSHAGQGPQQQRNQQAHR
jgi:hypothetical protein